jgi:general secretion pathway protein E
MNIDETIRPHIQACATASQIKAAAMAAGMRTLRDNGIAMILAGTTTIEEVERVTMRSTVAAPNTDVTPAPPAQ